MFPDQPRRNGFRSLCRFAVAFRGAHDAALDAHLEENLDERARLVVGPFVKPVIEDIEEGQQLFLRVVGSREAAGRSPHRSTAPHDGQGTPAPNPLDTSYDLFTRRGIGGRRHRRPPPASAQCWTA
jgi:hypothetical protein